ncbi:class I adenylate-forming enzyme family protein [Williamsia maris]|uniref:Acyl-CoA synthetase (AMP-forming)/AMP-acid ligase II n=1 Tax=Williamsia maris TaxID=72806 RepID=A0ABT1HB96_9NOCA|nr:class I adenylate-forming enzyme family protein [Williamsia maris]MCP2175521.1 Acyl-CoA synthetase (AMP-forming)/AMP-acid ligase II [Williamsia maris]
MTTINEDPAAVTSAYDDIVDGLTRSGADYEMIETPSPHGSGTVRHFRHASPTLDAIVSDFEDRHGPRSLTIGHGGSYTYSEVFARSRRLAWSLHHELGITAADRVGIMMLNRADYLVALFAAIRIGAVAVLLNSRASVSETRDALADVPCAVVLADGKRIDQLQTIGTVACLVTVDAGQADTDVRSIDDLIDRAVEDAPQASAHPDETSVILFTSGTSGRAKGVALSHRAMGTVVHNMRFVTDVNLEFASRTYSIPIADMRPLMPTVSTLLVFPLFHVSGIAALMVTMNSGGVIATMPRWSPEEAVRLISENGLTLMAGPPLTVDELLSVPGSDVALSSLINVVPGGQATPPNVTAKISTGLPNAQRSAGWGMTEVGGSVCTANGQILRAIPTTSGPMSPTMDVRVTDGGAVLQTGEVGELEIRGGQVMSEYVGRPAETREAFVDGWLRTGDVGYVDEYNLVHIVDRKKDIVISAGENISCAEVEAVIAASGLFEEVAAFGVPDDRLGERLVVAVSPADGITVDVEDVLVIARTTLPEYKIPSAVQMRTARMPRTATGKVLKRLLRDEYQRHSAGVATTERPLQS